MGPVSYSIPSPAWNKHKKSCLGNGMQSQKKPQGRQERLTFRQNQRKTNKKAGPRQQESQNTIARIQQMSCPCHPPAAEQPEGKTFSETSKVFMAVIIIFLKLKQLVGLLSLQKMWWRNLWSSWHYLWRTCFLYQTDQRKWCKFCLFMWFSKWSKQKYKRKGQSVDSVLSKIFEIKKFEIVLCVLDVHVRRDFISWTSPIVSLLVCLKSYPARRMFCVIVCIP